MSEYLQLSWSTSRGRDTEGWTIVRLDDTAMGKRYRTMGGGYDMVGTVFADWLADRWADRIAAIPESEYPDLYGLFNYGNGPVLDGACGISSMERIAKRIGLRVKHHANRRGQLVALSVDDVGA